MGAITETVEIEGIPLKGLRFSDGEFLIFAKERIKFLKLKGIKTNVSYQEQELKEDKWKVKCFLTIFEGRQTYTYENFCVREGNFALEIAATIALSRAIAIAGYTIEYSVSSAEGYAENKSLKNREALKEIIENRITDKPKEVAPIKPLEKIEPEKKVYNFSKKKEKKIIKPLIATEPDEPKPKTTLKGSNAEAIEYLEEHNIDYKSFAKIKNVDLRKLVSQHKKGNIIDFVKKEYGKLATVYCGEKVPFKEKLKTTLPQDMSFNPEINHLSDDVPRKGMELAKLKVLFKAHKVSDEKLIATLKLAGISEFKSVDEFVSDAESELIEMVILEYNMKWKI